MKSVLSVMRVLTTQSLQKSEITNFKDFSKIQDKIQEWSQPRALVLHVGILTPREMMLSVVLFFASPISKQKQ